VSEAWGLDDTSPTQALLAGQKALARSHSYGLFGRFYLEGLTKDTLAPAKAIPELAATLPNSIDFDQLAADHQHLFGFNLYPYQSIFLDSSGLLGGDITAGVLLAYEDAGFDVGVSSESADHIGHELRFLSYLCGLEAGSPGAGAIVAQQRAFLEGHLLRWLPVLVLAIRQERVPFYVSLARLTLDIVAEHWDSLEHEPSVFKLPKPPNLLADERTGLKEIVAYLLTPVTSGFFLSRDDIGRLARELSVPRGFGGRQQLLLNLLRSAANYEALPAVLELLGELIAAWIAGYQEMSVRPELSPFSNVWLARATQTAGLIGDIERHLETLE
jgi:TorA maturation chaperone TorD